MKKILIFCLLLIAGETFGQLGLIGNDTITKPPSSTTARIAFAPGTFTPYIIRKTGNAIPFSESAVTKTNLVLGTGLSFSSGSGTNAVLGLSPVTIALSGVQSFGTSLTSPLIIGGTGTTSTLTFKATSGNGTTNSDIYFKVGNNGATTAMQILNTGVVRIPLITSKVLAVNGSGDIVGITGTSSKAILGDATAADIFTPTGSNVNISGTGKTIGSIAISIPQSVATSAIPTFAGMNLNGTLTGKDATLLGAFTVKNGAGTLNHFAVDADGHMGMPTISSAYNLRISKELSGATTYGSMIIDGQVQSGVTTEASYLKIATGTANSSFALSTMNGIEVIQGTIGASSTVYNQFAFNVKSSLIGASINGAYRSQIAKATNRFGLYFDGNADNYLEGNLGVGYSIPVSTLAVDGNMSIGASFSDASALVDLVSTTKGLLPPRMTGTQRDAISSPATGLVVFNTTTNRLNFYNGSAWIALLPVEVAATKSAVSASTNMRFVSVTADETYSGNPATLYFHTGTSLKFVPIF